MDTTTAHPATTAAGEARADPFVDTGGVSVIPQLRGHLPALDGLRGLAIALVMLCHFLPYRDQATSLIGRLFFFVGRAGWSGVDLFFVLSGFLITGILLDAKGTPHYFRNFYARRTLRIFPLYYGVLVVVFLVLPLIRPSAFADADLQAIQHRQGWLWLYGTNVAMTRVNDMSLFHAHWLDLNPFWSLAVEEHFYLVWPALAFFLTRRALGWTCAAFVALSAALRAAFYLHGNLDDAIYVFTPCRVDALAIGALITILMRSGQHAGPVAAARGWIVSNAALLVTLLGLATIATLWFDPGRDRMWNTVGGYTLVAVFYAALLIRCVTAPTRSATHWLFTTRLMRGLGKYSYGIYVYHVVLASTMDRLFGQRQMDAFLKSHGAGRLSYGVSVVLYIAFASLFSFGVAWLSWQLFEKQFLKLKRYFEYRER